VVAPALDEEDRYPQLRNAREQVVGLARSVLVLPLLVLGLVLAATVVGLPVLAGVLAIARSAAALDRYRADAMLGVRVAAPQPVPAPTPHSLAHQCAPTASWTFGSAATRQRTVTDEVAGQRPVVPRTVRRANWRTDRSLLRRRRASLVGSAWWLGEPS
jgi:hypothetical protein